MSKFLTAVNQSPETAFEKLFIEVERIILGQSGLIEKYLIKALGKGKVYRELRKALFSFADEKSIEDGKQGQDEIDLRARCETIVTHKATREKLWNLMDRLIFLKRKLRVDKEAVEKSFNEEAGLIQEYDKLMIERLKIFTDYGTMEVPKGCFG